MYPKGTRQKCRPYLDNSIVSIVQNFFKIFKKGIDKQKNLCYTKYINKKRGCPRQALNVVCCSYTLMGAFPNFLKTGREWKTRESEFSDKTRKPAKV